ncbi:MAG: hypothetical protein WCG87_10855 [Bacteroidota bacterium]
MKGINRIIIFTVLIFGLIVPTYVIAQPPPFDNGSGGDTQDTVPLDGGISLLLIAGVGYGVKKVHQKRLQVQQVNIEQHSTYQVK